MITQESYLKPDVVPKVARRLQAIEGQVRGLQRMVDEGRHCIDLLTQIASVQEALSQVGKLVLRNYLETCASKGIRSGNAQEVYDEIMEIVYKFVK